MELSQSVMNIPFYGSGRRRHVTNPKTLKGGGSALPKLMSNLQLFDSSVISSKGKGIKPSFSTKKPIKFII
jgi:hypothetical protein